MTLSFSRIWPNRLPSHMAGKPNNFPEKILKGLIWEFLEKKNESFSEAPSYVYDYGMRFGVDYVAKIDAIVKESRPKLHTLRADPSSRWGAGNDIHFVINNRTSNRFQFAPVVKCVSVQEILIDPNGFFRVIVDGKRLDDSDIMRLAINDGFDSVEDFFHWFDQPFKGKIIHWTELKY